MLQCSVFDATIRRLTVPIFFSSLNVIEMIHLLYWEFAFHWHRFRNISYLLGKDSIKIFQDIRSLQESKRYTQMRMRERKSITEEEDTRIDKRT